MEIINSSTRERPRVLQITVPGNTMRTINLRGIDLSFGLTVLSSQSGLVEVRYKN